MLAICIIFYIMGGLLVTLSSIIIISTLTGRFYCEANAGVGIAAGMGVALLGAAIWSNIVGIKQYEKETKIYTLQPAETFVLGIGNGSYYYDVSEGSDINIKKVSAHCTTLIMNTPLDYPYIKEVKEKWEDSKYYIYIPEDTKIIQYTVK